MKYGFYYLVGFFVRIFSTDLINLHHLCRLCAEASAKTKDGVQCAFEELVEKILQTPGLWESENQGQKIQLSGEQQGGGRACGGYCSIP